MLTLPMFFQLVSISTFTTTVITPKCSLVPSVTDIMNDELDDAQSPDAIDTCEAQCLHYATGNASAALCYSIIIYSVGSIAAVLGVSFIVSLMINIIMIVMYCCNKSKLINKS